MHRQQIDNLIKVFSLTNVLKRTYRSHHVVPNRMESVADHSWRLALMVLFTAPYLDEKINLEKALKMAIIHDLGECLAGDTNLLKILNNDEIAKEKQKLEYRFFLKIKKLVVKVLGEEILSLWKEFEKNVSYEAKVVNALDKLESQFHQNQIGSSYLNKFREENKMQYIESFFPFDSFILLLKNKAFESAGKFFPRD